MENLINITPLVEAVIALAAALVTAYLIPWLRAKYNGEQLARVRIWVEIAVSAAEKLYGAGHGAEKFQHAEQILRAKGIRLDTAELMAMIDAQIKKMEQQDRGAVTIIEQIGDAVPATEESDEDLIDRI